jgi:hypothetical protein
MLFSRLFCAIYSGPLGSSQPPEANAFTPALIAQLLFVQSLTFGSLAVPEFVVAMAGS